MAAHSNLLCDGGFIHDVGIFFRGGTRCSTIGSRAAIVCFISPFVGHEQAANGSRRSAVGSEQAAEGRRCSAVGSKHAAEGRRCSAVGSKHAAEGRRCSAVGSKHAAEGRRCSAVGSEHAAEGRRSNLGYLCCASSQTPSEIPKPSPLSPSLAFGLTVSCQVSPTRSKTYAVPEGCETPYWRYVPTNAVFPKNLSAPPSLARSLSCCCHVPSFLIRV
jgi:hypothetical protein